MIKDPLDQLLSAARWPEPSTEALGRLERTVRGPQSSRYPWARYVATVAAAAIAAAIGLVLSVQLRSSSGGSGTIRSVAVRLEMPPARSAAEGLRLASPILVTPLSVRDRYGMILASIHRDAPRSQPPLVALPAVAVSTSDTSLASLQKLLVQPKKQQILVRILPSAKSWAIESLIGQAMPGETKVACLSELLRRGSGETAFVLNCLADPRDRSAAQSAFQASHMATDRLIAQFSSPWLQVRFAAGAALGRQMEDADANRLIDMIHQNHHRREALATLMASPNLTARKFIEDFAAMGNAVPSGSSELRSVRSQLPSWMQPFVQTPLGHSL